MKASIAAQSRCYALENTPTRKNKSSERNGRAFLGAVGGRIRATRDRELQTGMEKQKRKKERGGS